MKNIFKKTARLRVAAAVHGIVGLLVYLNAIIKELDKDIQANRDERDSLKAKCHEMHVVRGTAESLRKKLDGLL